ncbi:MAG: glycoside hydrolase family 2 TIM barrel-domain containing protein [Verrucomicrobiota bacterium]
MRIITNQQMRQAHIHFAIGCLLLTGSSLSAAADYHDYAPTPPMGWNSWDCFGTTVSEAQTRQQADFMAEKLKAHGWRYVVVDIQWYQPTAKGHDYEQGARLTMDGFGRLLPAPEKFPSATNGQGFQPLADYVHRQGLKFGIHMMRGIPRQAVRQNTPIKETPYHAADIADTNSLCEWNPDMFGVDLSRPGAQAYYDSLLALVASWGVDFVKVDDLSRPYHQAEIEAIRKAIDKTGRPVVFSTSPGATPLAAAANVNQNANLWRISDDFWDKWPLLLEQFKRLDDWTPFRLNGAWPDADMLPLGIVDFNRHTRFTTDEQFTLMTLWSIARSPLMQGGDMTRTDDFTFSLFTNDEVLAVNQHSANNRQLFRTNGLAAWTADAPGAAGKYLAVFNTCDRISEDPASAKTSVPVNLADLGFSGQVLVRDLWRQENIAIVGGGFAPEVPAHGARLFRLVAPARLTEDFDAGWLFSRGDFSSAMVPAFDDHGWRPVPVPHDWSSEGPFSAEYASGTGYAPGGVGWYRKHFRLDQSQPGHSAALEFDGVYDNSEVWINGQFVGGRPFGFIGFQCDLTPYLKRNQGENVVAVRVDHSRLADSRFYTGSGIFRNVRLVITDPLRIAPAGVFVTTPKIKTDFALVRIETVIENRWAGRRAFSLESDLVAPGGEQVAGRTMANSAAGNSVQTLVQEIKVPRPELWSLPAPALYTLKSRVKSGDTVVDETDTQFGIRSAAFDANQGFFLNDLPIKLKGVCLHHDAGSLGAAVPDKVLERRLKALKEIGVNAIRTSHNPPDPALLNLCDRLGFLVMDEAFDEFTPAKNKWVFGVNVGVPARFGYAELFAQWSVTDISDLIRRDRNHPSVILWSVGNEIDYANDPFSDPVLGGDYHPENPPASDLAKCAAPLVAAVKSLDHTRLVTAALATVRMSNVVGLPELLDAVGYNYQEGRYAADHAKFPKRIIYGSENSQQYGAWRAVQTNSYIAGQFLWTGIDYLGEAGAWPNRANGAGLLDLCGFKKPLGWFRQSLWSDRPMVYLCASDGRGGPRRFPGIEKWNWQSNSTVTVYCFANCPEVTLLLNGQVVGTKLLSEAVNGVLLWRVPFEPGMLEAVGHAGGPEVCHYVMKTAGPAKRIELLPDSTQLRADGKDICHVEFRIVDENGVRVPDAEPEVTFDLTGLAGIIGAGNADLNSIEDCKTNQHRAFQGRGLVILQAATVPGVVSLKATAPGLDPASLTLPSR